MRDTAFVAVSTALCLGVLTVACESKEAALDAVVQEVHEKQRNIGLSAAIWHGGRVAYSKKLGQADLENEVPVTAATRFGIGSITKAFTAVVVLQLESEGRLNLDTRVQEYVPEFPVKLQGEITVRQLLEHRAGLPHPQNRTPEFYATHFDNAVDALAVFVDEELLFEPGTDSNYSSSNYNLLAAVVEMVTGQRFPEVIEARILKPLALESTGFEDARFVLEGRARRYSFYHPYDYALSEEVYVVPVWDYSFNWGGGNMFSTAEDLARFGAVLLKPGLLPATQHEYFLSEAAFGSRDEDGRLVVYLSGGNPGLQAGLLVYPELATVGAVLSNCWGIDSRNGEMIKLAGKIALMEAGLYDAKAKRK